MNIFDVDMLDRDSIKNLSNESKAETIKEMEEYIDENNITEFWVFAEVAKENKKWYRILTTDRTEYFAMYIESRKRIMKK
jgi:hypothetical protein